MRRVTDKMVLTEKKLALWERVTFVDSSRPFEVMCVFKEGAILWSPTTLASDREVYSLIAMTDEEYNNKLWPRESYLNPAGIHKMNREYGFVIVCVATTSIRPKTVNRGSNVWDSSNIEGALIAWHMEACKTALGMFSKLPGLKDGQIAIAPPLQTKYTLAERDLELGFLFKNMGLELVGYNMGRCPDDWHMIQKM